MPSSTTQQNLIALKVATRTKIKFKDNNQRISKTRFAKNISKY